MVRSSPRAVLALSLALAALLAACGGGATQAQQPPSGPKHTLVIARSIEDAVTLDPNQAYEFSSIDVTHETYSNLVTYAQGNTTRVVPEVASSWSMSPDGMTWTFHLKKGVTFANGDPLTASDVVYSFERVVNLPKNPAAWLVTQMGITADNVASQVTAPDPYTVVIKLTQPVAPGAFLAIMAYPTTGIVDEKVVKEHVVNGDWGHGWLDDHSAGGGPYVLDVWDRASQIVLSVNKHWTLGPTPEITRVVYKDTPESTAQFDLLQRGGADVAITLTPQQLQQLQQSRKFKVVKKPDLSLEYLGLDVKNVPAQSQPLVRQAIKYAIDYQGIVKDLLSGNAIMNQGIVPEGMYGYDSSLPYHQDIAKAKQLMAQAGYPNGYTATMLVPSENVPGGVSGSDLATVIKNDLAKIGITVNLQVEQSSELYTTYRAQKSQMVLAQWAADYPDPDDFAKPFGDYNTQSLAWRLNWNDPQLTQLVVKAGSLPNGAERASLYKQINEYEMQNGAFVILYQPLITDAMASDLSNVFINPIWGIELSDVTKS
jgi:peptide/nickel transport system substrate-binding protein